VIPRETDIYRLNRDEAFGSGIEPSCLIHHEATLVINSKENLSLTLFLTEDKGKELEKLPSCEIARKGLTFPA
jgi:hypothetical protein